MTKGTILVVEDEMYIMHILQFVLGMEGYEVLEATNGVQALEILQTRKPDLVITDDLMPKMGGLELTSRIRQNDDHKEIPIIMLGASHYSVDKTSAFKAGADDHICKPFSPRKLVERINQMLGQKK